MSSIRRIGVLLLTVALPPTGGGQTPGNASRVATARDPRPQDATRAILAALDSFRVVALGDAHGTKDLDDFTLSLIRHSAFPGAVNDIVVECLNSRLQARLDRYVAGESVSSSDAQQLWRDQTHPPCSVDDFHMQLLQLVRRINEALPPAKRLRVLAGEPPLDWSTTTPETHRQFLEQRDAHAASIVDAEVLSKNRKALMLYGLGHLFHGMTQMAVGRYEKKYPGVTFVIAPYLGVQDGPRCGAPAFVAGISLDAKMASWPAPSLARAKDTWLADFVQSQFARTLAAFGASANPIDAYLYLGPPNLLLAAPPSTVAFLDTAFIAELHRRASVMTGGQFRDDRIEPDKVRERGADVFACRRAP